MPRGCGETGDFLFDSHGAFDDPFFTGTPDWDETILAHSEVPFQADLESEVGEEFEESESTQERAAGVLFSTLLVAASLGKLALIPFGF